MVLRVPLGQRRVLLVHFILAFCFCFSLHLFPACFVYIGRVPWYYWTVWTCLAKAVLKWLEYWSLMTSCNRPASFPVSTMTSSPPSCNSDVHVKNQPKRSVLNKGISVHFYLKTNVMRMCLSFRWLRRQFWTEGGGLQIFETFWGAIDAIETLISWLQIGVNIRGVNCSFPKK